MSVQFFFDSFDSTKRKLIVMSTALSCLYSNRSNCKENENVFSDSRLIVISISVPHNHRLPTNGTPSSLPVAPSIQSLSVQIKDANNNNEIDEKEQLKNDLLQLKNELQKSKETIARLQKSEEQMRER